MVDPLQAGRDAFGRRAWAAAASSLQAADSSAPLAGDDLERLAVAAHLSGDDTVGATAWARAHQVHLAEDDLDRAVRCAFWLALVRLLGGDVAQAGGWLARAQHLVDRLGGQCVGRGLLLVPASLDALGHGRAHEAERCAMEATEVARAHDDRDLLALGLVATGQARLALGDRPTGLASLDEAMVGVTADEVAPVPAGIAYCAVIDTCLSVHDLRRAGEWTDALTRWCDAQPELVPFRGQCLVHRSQLLQLHGDWDAAADAAERATARLAEPPHPARGAAWYQRGEVHRLRGEHDAARRAYEAAAQHGYEPDPGFALLRLAEGRLDLALASIRRAGEEGRDPCALPVLLAARTEIALAAGERHEAEEAAARLAALATAADATMARALADHASGAVRLAGAEPVAALPPLRAAVAAWRQLDVPYEEARSRELVAQACAALGDEDAATLERSAARSIRARLDTRVDARHDGEASPLTAREREVLGLVAQGRTNREIGRALVISEHTVARHLQNIFTKLDLSSRVEATAYAYEHGLR